MKSATMTIEFGDGKTMENEINLPAEGEALEKHARRMAEAGLGYLPAGIAIRSVAREEDGEFVDFFFTLEADGDAIPENITVTYAK